MLRVGKGKEVMSQVTVEVMGTAKPSSSSLPAMQRNEEDNPLIHEDTQKEETALEEGTALEEEGTTLDPDPPFQESSIEAMCSEITDEKIRKVMWSLPANKAPGPNGYSAGGSPLAGGPFVATVLYLFG
ncbi:hypothetical protein U1Q18_032796 [Sarracenia purpurea var. burkii]